MQKISDVKNTLGCIHCSPCGTPCKQQVCTWCEENSFLPYPKAKLWAYDLNNRLTPKNFRPSSTTEVFFRCDKPQCGHIYHQEIKGAAFGYGCFYYCYGATTICLDTSCQLCFNKSFASDERSQYWDYEKNEGATPRHFMKNCHESFWFKCKERGHSFRATLNNITNMHSWCTLCHNKTEGIVERWLTSTYPERANDIKGSIRYIWTKSLTGNYLPFDLRIANIIIEIDGV